MGKFSTSNAMLSHPSNYVLFQCLWQRTCSIWNDPCLIFSFLALFLFTGSTFATWYAQSSQTLSTGELCGKNYEVFCCCNKLIIISPHYYQALYIYLYNNFMVIVCYIFDMLEHFRTAGQQYERDTNVLNLFVSQKTEVD